jgi:Resolvase, N terminal domain
MIKKARKAALYVRVSTDKQTVANQIEALAAVAAARGWDVIATYQDNGVSGAKGRKDRPGLDTLLNDAQRGKFNIVMAWAIDRIRRSLIDLLGTIQHLEACGCDLYLDQQAIDTTTPAGKLRDIDAQFEELAVDLGSAPQRVLKTHSSDHIAHLFVNPWPPTARTRFPSSVRGEAHSMPTHNSLGPDEASRIRGQRR